MAQQEHDRENLLRDAVAFVDRIEWRAPDGREVFMGMRNSGGASIYLDQDPVYHFTSDDRLRRAFVAGRLYKADQCQLVEMHRQRTDDEVQLVSRTLGTEATEELLQAIQHELRTLLDDLRGDRLTRVGLVTQQADFAQRCVEWLARLVEGPPQIAESPHAR